MNAAPPDPVLRTPAHGVHEALGAAFGTVGTWEVPRAYAGRDEARAAEVLGVVDVSPFAKVELQGSGAVEAALEMSARTVIRVGDGRAALAVAAPGEASRMARAADALRARGIVKGRHDDGVKILGDGELTKPLTVRAAKFSASARQKIEAAGGSVVIPEGPYRGGI